MKFTPIHYVLLLAAVLVMGFLYLNSDEPTSLGATVQGNDYYATSTAPNVAYGATVTGDRLLRTGSGALGTVIITGANTGVINFYDATTTDVNLRTGSKATSTILLASIPASLAAGNYVFDIAYSFGLLLELEGGTMPTSTITFR